MHIETEFEWNNLLENSSSVEEAIKIISSAKKYDYWMASTDALKKCLNNLSSINNSDDFIFIYKFVDKHIDASSIDYPFLIDSVFSKIGLRDEIIDKIPKYFSSAHLGKKKCLHRFVDTVSKNNSETVETVSTTLDRLIKAGTSTSLVAKETHPVSYAFGRGSVPIIRSFFKKFGDSLIDGAKSDPYTPVCQQILNGSVSSIKELLELGADPHKMGNSCLFLNALQACVHNEFVDKFLVLIESNCFTEEQITNSVRYFENSACSNLVTSWLSRRNIEKLIDNYSKNSSKLSS